MLKMVAYLLVQKCGQEVIDISAHLGLNVQACCFGLRLKRGSADSEKKVWGSDVIHARLLGDTFRPKTHFVANMHSYGEENFCISVKKLVVVFQQPNVNGTASRKFLRILPKQIRASIF